MATVGGAEDPPAGRLVVAVSVVIGLTLLCLLLGTGLGTGSPHGAGDNGDGVRLYCGAGLVPTTPDRQANWKGVVVDTFRTGETPCSRPLPSSALYPVLATARLTGPTWNLRVLGWSWTGVLVVGLGAAAAAAGAARPWRSLVVLPVVLPLAFPTFSRFFLSTYGEPAGLAGTALALAGVAAAAGGTPRGPARWIALAVALGGAVLAATAKPAYAVVLVPVLVVGALAAPTRSRAAGLVLTLAVACGAAVPIADSVAVQDRLYGPVNTHDLVFTALGPDSGGDVLGALGLPASASRALGAAYYPDGGASVEDWGAVVGAQWPALRAGAAQYVATHPLVALRMVDGAMRATSDPTLGYLPSQLRGEPGTHPIRVPDPPAPEQGASRATLDPWLRSRPLALLPWAVLAAAVVMGVGVARRPAGAPARALGLLAATAAATMALLAVAAVLGDGFFEIAKHTWLAAYAGAVATVAVVAAVGSRIAEVVHPPRVATDDERPATAADETFTAGR